MRAYFAKVIARPSGADRCDVCGERAVCDSPTRMGPWGYLCGACFAKVGVSGVGYLFADSAEPKGDPQ